MYDMTARNSIAGLVIGGLLVAAPAVWAQQPPTAPAHAVPRPDDLEPGVNTSATPPPAAPVVRSKAESPAPAAKPAAPARTANDGAKAANAAGRGGKAQDHLQLDTTDITGNQELPKVLYIVPWKRSDLGDLLGKPAHSLLDEVLEPVDRDVFRRESRYYDALQPDAAAGADKAGGAAGHSSVEKAAGDKH
ncbi:MAG: hypothetical protein ACREU6_05945 [Steroidobacteraceae bacterium]